jgi:hypothetical protein
MKARMAALFQGSTVLAGGSFQTWSFTTLSFPIGWARRPAYMAYGSTVLP